MASKCDPNVRWGWHKWVKWTFSILFNKLEIAWNFGKIYVSQVGSRSRVFWNFNFDSIINELYERVFNLQFSPIENNF